MPASVTTTIRSLIAGCRSRSPGRSAAGAGARRHPGPPRAGQARGARRCPRRAAPADRLASKIARSSAASSSRPITSAGPMSGAGSTRCERTCSSISANDCLRVDGWPTAAALADGLDVRLGVGAGERPHGPPRTPIPRSVSRATPATSSSMTSDGDQAPQERRTWAALSVIARHAPAAQTFTFLKAGRCLGFTSGR